MYWLRRKYSPLFSDNTKKIGSNVETINLEIKNNGSKIALLEQDSVINKKMIENLSRKKEVLLDKVGSLEKEMESLRNYNSQAYNISGG